MALIDVVKWDAAGDELVWKFPNSELSTLTQLIVHQTQWAILFKNGQQLDVFEAGRHTLSTNNIPLLNKLVNLPFGGTSPFAAEVWYVNRAVSLDLKWGTPNPMQLEDPQYGIIVPVSAFGQMGLRVVDPGLLVRSLVGSLRAFSAIAVLQHFKGVLVSQLKVAISSAIVKRRRRRRPNHRVRCRTLPSCRRSKKPSSRRSAARRNRSESDLPHGGACP